MACQQLAMLQSLKATIDALEDQLSDLLSDVQAVQTDVSGALAACEMEGMRVSKKKPKKGMKKC